MNVTLPVVLNKRRGEIPAGAVYIGRPSPFGNPFVLGQDGTREEVIEKYRAYFNERIMRDDKFRMEVEALRTAPALVCFCAPLACHGDAIVEYLGKGHSNSA